MRATRLMAELVLMVRVPPGAMLVAEMELMAGRVAALGIPCFGCTPKLLVKVVERVLKGQDLGPLVTSEST